MALKEACIGTLEEAIRAERSGADRLEVCESLNIGGVTPNEALLTAVIESVQIPCVAIIRPRGGNFVYNDEEFEVILDQISICKALGYYGIAVGVLTRKGEIDLDKMRLIMMKAKGISVTFHMAFDEIQDKFLALEQLVNLKVDRILTKGCTTKAFDGIDCLKKLVDTSGNRIVIMPGGGVTRDNYKYLIEATGALEVHGTKIV